MSFRSLSPLLPKIRAVRVSQNRKYAAGQPNNELKLTTKLHIAEGGLLIQVITLLGGITMSNSLHIVLTLSFELVVIVKISIIASLISTLTATHTHTHAQKLSLMVALQFISPLLVVCAHLHPLMDLQRK